jgi:hypothetical protein
MSALSRQQSPASQSSSLAAQTNVEDLEQMMVMMMRIMQLLPLQPPLLVRAIWKPGRLVGFKNGRVQHKFGPRSLLGLIVLPRNKAMWAIAWNNNTLKHIASCIAPFGQQRETQKQRNDRRTHCERNTNQKVNQKMMAKRMLI